MRRTLASRFLIGFTLAHFLSACGVDGNLAYLLAGEDDPAVRPDAADAAEVDAADDVTDTSLGDASADVEPDASVADAADGAFDPDAADAADGVSDADDVSDVVLPPIDLVLPDVVEPPDVVMQPDIIDAGAPMPDVVDVPPPNDTPDVVVRPDIVDAGMTVPDVVMAMDRPDVVVQPDVVMTPDVVTRPDIVDVVAPPDRPDVVMQPDIVDAGAPMPDVVDVPPPNDTPDVVTQPDVVDVPPADVPPPPPVLEVWYTPDFRSTLVPNSGRVGSIATGLWNGMQWDWINRTAAPVADTPFMRITVQTLTPTQINRGEIALTIEGACGFGVGTCPSFWAEYWRVYWNGRLYTAADTNNGVPYIRLGNDLRCTSYGYSAGGCVIFTIPPATAR